MRFDLVACRVLTVISGYVTMRATHPAAAPDTASTAAGGAILLHYGMSKMKQVLWSLGAVQSF